MTFAKIDVENLIRRNIQKHIDIIDKQLTDFDHVKKNTSVFSGDARVFAIVPGLIDEQVAGLIVLAYLNAGWAKVTYTTVKLPEGLGPEKPQDFCNMGFYFYFQATNNPI